MLSFRHAKQTSKNVADTMAFLMMLSVILLSMLMIILSIPSVIGHLICGNNNGGKTQLVWFDWSDNIGSIDVKMDGSVLGEKILFKMLRLTFSSKLN